MDRARQFMALAGLTAAECVRQPVHLLLTTTAVVLTGLAPMLAMHQFGEEGRLARDAGLALQLTIGLAVAVTAASAALSRERIEGTSGALLSKPVGRTVVFFGKYAGVAVVVTGFSVCALLATLMGERVSERFLDTPSFTGFVTDYPTGIRLLLAVPAAYAVAGAINYLTRRPFASVAFRSLLGLLGLALVLGAFLDRTGRPAAFGFQMDWRIVPAALLVTFALLAMAAFALTLSVRLGAVPTLAVCAALLALGLVSAYLFRDEGAATTLYRVTPDWQHFWMPDALRSGGTIPGSYVVQAGLYGACWTTAVLCFGAWLFRRSEAV
jgi:hypothetical protein